MRTPVVATEGKKVETSALLVVGQSAWHGQEHKSGAGWQSVSSPGSQNRDPGHPKLVVGKLPAVANSQAKPLIQTLRDPPCRIVAMSDS
jgi:hypothetical protein